MTATRGPGGMLLITRLEDDEFSARFLCGASFYEFSGARDPDVRVVVRDAEKHVYQRSALFDVV